mmetsp:Transcript_3252/g.9444  ORF Transcript_3252/g.9444 Transcript_3252/m.9444 type:complete len:204 (-) Transcript_3252:100-711(-)
MCHLIIWLWMSFTAEKRSLMSESAPSPTLTPRKKGLGSCAWPPRTMLSFNSGGENCSRRSTWRKASKQFGVGGPRAGFYLAQCICGIVSLPFPRMGLISEHKIPSLMKPSSLTARRPFDSTLKPTPMSWKASPLRILLDVTLDERLLLDIVVAGRGGRGGGGQGIIPLLSTPPTPHPSTSTATSTHTHTARTLHAHPHHLRLL